jgi:hypothetical protein
VDAGVSSLQSTPAGTAQQRAFNEAPEGQPPSTASDGTRDKDRPEISAVAVLPVHGASDKGNAELTVAMRQALSSAGWSVLEKPRQDALTITGKGSPGSPRGGFQKVALVWSVAAPDGTILGTITQANTVPAGSLDADWDEMAPSVAAGAASGIFELVNKLR